MNKLNRRQLYLHHTGCPKCNSRIRRLKYYIHYKTKVKYKSSYCIRCNRQKNKLYKDPLYYKQWQIKNADYIRAYQRKHYTKDKHKERNSINARRLRERLVFNDRAAIKEFYLQCPLHMTVDHIVPLNGKYVSGLHTIHNLQYLTKSANSSKSNKYSYEMG